MDATAIILAAGMGSRLVPHTINTPKCLVPVAGLPILHHQLRALAECGIRSVITVEGYLEPLITSFIRDLGMPLDIAIVKNSNYATTGTAHSLACGIGTYQAGEFWIIEGDVVFKPAIIKHMQKEPGPVGAVSALEPGITGTYVCIDDEGHIARCLHASVQNENPPTDEVFKTVNIWRFPELQATTLLAPALLSWASTARPSDPLEYFIDHLCWKRRVGIHAYLADSQSWCEVDDAADLRRANELFSITPCAVLSP